MRESSTTGVQQCLSILDLVSDVLGTILGLLRPPDLICVRLTCKCFRDASIQRTVWVEVLNEMMKEHGIPTPTYPVSKLDRRSLERLALSPKAFHRKLNCARSSGSVTPTFVQHLIPDLDKTQMGAYGLQPTQRMQISAFVPGGRFLITNRSANKNYDVAFLQLWDLGIYTHLQQPKCIVNFVLDTGPRCVPRADRIRLAPSLDGTEFILIACRRHESLAVGGLDTVIEGVKIKPFAPQPSAVTFTKFTLDGFSIDTCIITSNRMVAVLKPGCLLVWDFLKDEVAIWKSMHFSIKTDKLCTKIQMFGDRLLAFHESILVLWDIPNSIPRSHWREHLTEDTMLQAPRTVYDLADYGWPNNPETKLRCLPPNVWNLWSNLPDYLVVFTTRLLPTLLLFHFDQLKNNSTTKLALEQTMKHLDTFVGNYDVGDSSYNAPRTCDTHVVFSSFRESDGVRLHLISRSSNTDNVGSIKVDWLTSQGYNISQSVICPATGRMCISVFSQSRYQILILDFLNTPSLF
ncbi:hypothetical protein CPB83DRAFT_854540 [Crepidotus variabilis]|uniref:F-box domain-containing protein n=1 Tax=Crepidotus variabilis TaxID=179855 RepID=A0A9P6EG98_9AGAR|nr:hypothetical protein CPB83DRAFT_854540 [Crepidotus variabilis]